MLNQNVINSEDLIIKPYHQKHGKDGFSGKLLLATAKNSDKQYIIKAGVAHVAACEFIFYKFVAKLVLSI